ncbi:MAG: ABC transporter permease [Acidimicrobiia bacterium]
MISEPRSPPEPLTLLEAPVAAPGRPRVGRLPRAPWFLWAAAIAILLPILIPLLHLLTRVSSAGSEAWAVLFSGRTLELLLNTVLLTAAVAAAASVVGVATAWLTVRTDLPGRRAWSVLAALPLVIPSYVFAFTMISAFGSSGIVTDLLGFRLLPQISGGFGAWLTLTLSTYPYVFLVAAAALRRIDPALEEAARGLGASRWRAFGTVVMPQLRPAIAAGGLLAGLYTLSDFGGVSLMRFDALARAIYAQYQGRLDRTPASVLALVLIVIAMVVIWSESRTRGRAAYFSARPGRPAPPVALRGWARTAALTFLGALVATALLVPVVVLASWLVRGVRQGEPLVVAWQAAAGSLSVSLAAALVAMVAAVPVAVLVVRHRSKASLLLDRSMYAVFALPHITVALAMVFFAANFVPALYQGLPLLVITYVALFLPQASGAARASLQQINPHLEEAARGLGRGPLRTLGTITVPLAARGLVAGGALVFLTTMKELPATLLLRPTGFDTLAIRVWSAATEGFFARAAAPALLLLLVSALPMYFFVTRNHDA